MPPPPPADWLSGDLTVPITLGAAVLVVVLWNVRLRIAKAILRQEADDGPPTAEELPPGPEAPLRFGLRSPEPEAPVCFSLRSKRAAGAPIHGAVAARVGAGGAPSGGPAQPISFGRRAPSSYARVHRLDLDMDDDT